jgi:hypothetical protein
MKAKRRDESAASKPLTGKIMNALTECSYGKSQAKDIKNAACCPKAQGYKKVKGAVSG